jgi:acyl-CoA synthetase (AMP-forming)/AMP-acid ligase II
MSKLFENIEKFKKKVALIDIDGSKKTYGQILNTDKKIKGKINSKSIILMICNNSIQSFTAYISFIKNGHITILLDISFSELFIKNIINKFKPNYIFSSKNYFKNDKLKKILDIDGYLIFKTKIKKNYKINYINNLLLTTSGTTQNPKMVRLSNKNLYANTKNIIDYLNIKSNHTTITTMPMAYSYGLSIINSHIEAGSSIVVNNKTIFDKAFWKAIEKFKVTSFGGVPSFYEMLKRLKVENMKLNSLKYLTQAGGKLDLNSLKNLNNIFKLKKIKFYIMYGQTEAGPRMSYLSPKMIDKFPGSIGKPLKNSFFEIIDESGKKIKNSLGEGELVFYGDNVSLGYAKNIIDLYKGDENKKKLYTGDIGIRNKEGFYFITGRKNRFIKISGLRIDIEDIEQFLKFKKNESSILVKDNKLEIQSVKKLNFKKITEKIFKKYKIRPNDIIFDLIERKESINFKK